MLKKAFFDRDRVARAHLGAEFHLGGLLRHVLVAHHEPLARDERRRWLVEARRRGRLHPVHRVDPRALAALASRLQVQERLTQQLAEAVEEALSPLGVLVVIDAGHACCELRGARAVGTMMTTSCARGVFLSDPAARAEAFSLFRR